MRGPVGLAVVAILALGLDAYLGPSRPDDQVAKQQEGYAGHDQFLADSDVCAGQVGSHSRKHPHPNLDSETGPDANNAVAIFTLLLVGVGYLQHRTMVVQQTTLAEQVALTRTVERPWLGPAKIEAGYLKSRGIIPPNEPFPIEITLRNSGKSPALRVTIRAESDINQTWTKPDAPPYSQLAIWELVGAIAPGESHPYWMGAQAVHPDDCGGLERGSLLYAVWGEVRYTDAFGNEHVTKFYWWRPGPTAGFCPTGPYLRRDSTLPARFRDRCGPAARIRPH